jgi:glutaredoxin-like YruB-family protein
MPKVTIYTTPTCAFCKQTKAFYEENNVEYEQKDVATDTAAAQEMVELSHQMGVPVSVIGEGDDKEVIVGFDKAALTKALGLS